MKSEYDIEVRAVQSVSKLGPNPDLSSNLVVKQAQPSVGMKPL